MWFLIFLVAVALTAGIYWSFRKKLNRRTAEHARRLEVLLAELKRDSHPAASATAEASPEIAAAPAAVPERTFGKKPRLLPQTGALLYLVFRTGLPDHEIFANLTLADLIEIEPAVRGYEREQKLRRLAQQRVDLVVCTKQLEVVAAVLIDISVSVGAAQTDSGFTESCLQAAGIRLLHVDTAAPPRHQQVRELVYGTRRSE